MAALGFIAQLTGFLSILSGKRFISQLIIRTSPEAERFHLGVSKLGEIDHNGKVLYGQLVFSFIEVSQPPLEVAIREIRSQ